MKTIHSLLVLVIAVACSFPVFAADDGVVCSSTDLNTTTNAKACDSFTTGNSYALVLAGIGAIGFIARRRRRS